MASRPVVPYARPASTSAPVRPDNVRGMAWMALAALAMVISNMLVKEAAATLPPAEIVFFRAVVVATILAPWVLRRPAALDLRRRWRLHLLRALLGTTAFVGMAYALANMVFADAVALAHTIPLWMIAISAAFLNERVGWRRSTATVAGFLGVVMIVRPSVEMNPFALAAVAAALLAAIEMFYVKRLTETVSVAGIVFVYSVLGVAFTALPAALVWVAPSGHDVALVTGVAVSAVIGHLTTVNAYRLGEASVVTPVGYMRMPFSVVIGLAMFAELPTAASLAGIAVILGATLYISFRESRLRRDERLESERLGKGSG